MQTFKLKIEVGHHPVYDRYDVADRLICISHRLQNTNDEEGILHDDEGNEIGTWSLADADDD